MATARMMAKMDIVGFLPALRTRIAHGDRRRRSELTAAS
jgi:hypothetical protein